MTDSRSKTYLDSYYRQRVKSLPIREVRLSKESAAANFLVNLISKFTPNNQLTLLDFGAGDFVLTEQLNEKLVTTYGVDIDDLDMRTGKTKFGDETFDVVLLMSIIEHLTDPSNLMNETKRILKKDGILIMVTPNWKYSYKNFYDDLTHIKPYTPSSLSFTLQMFDFQVRAVMPWSPRKNLKFLLRKNSIKICAHLPFRGDASTLIPKFLKGKSGTFLIVGQKPNSIG
jgi:2-polyprenyl-3-methyl-5-hydroxy-6-metoxy-1,4-benzoquinol methylase